MKNYFKPFISMVVLLGFCASSTTVYSSAVPKDGYTFEDQLQVALARQEAGTPFDAPLEIEWQEFFRQNVRQVEETLTKDETTIGDPKKELQKTLGLVLVDGLDHFATGDMDTHRYLFLHQVMAAILTNVQTGEWRGAISFVGGNGMRSFPDMLEYFNSIQFLHKNHFPDVREYLRNSSFDTRMVPFICDGKEYEFDHIHSSLFLTMECLYLPFIGEPSEVLFSLPQINAAFAHRIALGGIPTKQAGFDQTVNASSSMFLDHDMVHASMFNLLEKPVTFFGQESDPYYRAVYPVWGAMTECPDDSLKPKAQVAFFDAVHEGGYPPMVTRSVKISMNLKQYDGLKEAMETTPPAHGPAYFFPTDTEENFNNAALQELGLEAVDYVQDDETKRNHGEYFSEKSIFFYPTDASKIILKANDNMSYDDETDVACVPSFLAGRGYEPMKLQHYNDYHMLIDLGVELPEYLKEAGGSYFTLEALPGDRLAEYFRDEIYPSLLKVQRLKAEK